MNPPPRTTLLRKAPFGWTDLVVAVAFVLIATRFHLQPSRTFDPWLLLVFFPLIVVVHEAGHAVAALLVGTGCWR
ncbi:MAG TPA: hypothetical protein VFM40_01935 [Actinomycetota bacterium]|nr:hypothetical protein [Actinomycetota bacterium]